MTTKATTTDTPGPQRWGQIRGTFMKERLTLLAELRAMTAIYDAEKIPVRSSAKLKLVRALIDRLGMILAAGDAGILDTVATDRLKGEIFELRSWMTAPEHPRSVAVAQYDWLAKEHPQDGLAGASWPDLAELFCTCGKSTAACAKIGSKWHSGKWKPSFVTTAPELHSRGLTETASARVRGRG